MTTSVSALSRILVFATGDQQPAGVGIKSCSAPEEINSSDLNKLLGKVLEGSLE